MLDCHAESNASTGRDGLLSMKTYQETKGVNKTSPLHSQMTASFWHSGLIPISMSVEISNAFQAVNGLLSLNT